MRKHNEKKQQARKIYELVVHPYSKKDCVNKFLYVKDNTYENKLSSPVGCYWTKHSIIMKIENHERNLDDGRFILFEKNLKCRKKNKIDFVLNNFSEAKDIIEWVAERCSGKWFLIFQGTISEPDPLYGYYDKVVGYLFRMNFEKSCDSLLFKLSHGDIICPS